MRGRGDEIQWAPSSWVVNTSGVVPSTTMADIPELKNEPKILPCVHPGGVTTDHVSPPLDVYSTESDP